MLESAVMCEIFHLAQYNLEIALPVSLMHLYNIETANISHGFNHFVSNLMMDTWY